eukprot:4242907-Pyramimonas_sp.AAC.1
MEGHAAVAKALVAKGKADANAADGNGDTALALAAARGHTQVVVELLYAGAQAECLNAGDRLVRHENIPPRIASDWSVVRIYQLVLRPMGPS